MEENKAAPPPPFGVREEKGLCFSDNEGKTSPLRVHLRGAPFALSWQVCLKNEKQSRRGKHQAGGGFVSAVFMKDSLIKTGQGRGVFLSYPTIVWFFYHDF